VRAVTAAIHETPDHVELLGVAEPLAEVLRELGPAGSFL
jgi:hypothetical protein